MEIFITRHGQTEWNALGKVQGQTDIELNDIGRKQAEETGKLIGNENIDLIIASPLKRARETANIINKNIGLNIVEDSRLVERCFGNSEGLTKEERNSLKSELPEISDIWNYNKNVDVNNIEKMQDFCKRIYDMLDETLEKNQGKNILLVTHGGVAVVIKCYFMKFPLEKFIDRDSMSSIGNCEVLKFSV